MVQAPPLSHARARNALAYPRHDDPKPTATASDVLDLLDRFVDQGNILAAETYPRSAVDTGDSRAMMPLRMVVRDLGRREESVQLFKQAMDSGRIEALMPLGLVLYDLGKLDEATEVLQQAVAASI